MLTNDKAKQSEAPKITEVFDYRFRIMEQLQKEDNLNKVFNII